MERFLKRDAGHVDGIISGFDRILFRGTLRLINYSKGMEIWLSSRGIFMKHFALQAHQLSQRLKEHARTLAEKHSRPLIYRVVQGIQGGCCTPHHEGTGH